MAGDDEAGPAVTADAGVALAAVDAAAVDAAPPPVPGPAAALALADHVRLAASRVTFAQLAAASGGRYRYVQSIRSWTGVAADTSIWVVGGRVVRRSFRVWRGDGRHQKVFAAWTERGRQVGRHRDDGDRAVTMEALYDECERTIDSVHHVDGLRFVLGFDDRGLLATCTTEHKDCSDPCPQGAQIGLIEFEAAP